MIRYLIAFIFSLAATAGWSEDALGLGPAPATAGGSGTVTSVAETVPAELSVAGSPVTTTGTLALTWATASGNKVIASPSDGTLGGYAGRAVVAADIPSLAASKITSGQLAVAQGGTGLDLSTMANGKLLIGNGTGATAAVLTALTGQTVTNASGAISLGPTSYTIACDCAQHDHTGDTLANTLKQVTIPAGLLTTGTALEIYTLWSDSGDANNKAINIKTGSTTWYTATLTTGLSHRARCVIGGRGTASQISFVNSVATDGSSSGAVVTTAIDFSVQQTLDFTCQLTTTTTNHVALETVIVRLIAP